MIDVTDETFEHEVLEAHGPVVVDFWAPWCGPCATIEPILEAIDAAHDNVAFVKLDIESSPLTPSRYGVLSIPTVILFEGGEPRETVIGARSRAHYERVWADWLG